MYCYHEGNWNFGRNDSISFYVPYFFLFDIRPIYIGKNQNPKNLGFLLYHLHCQKNP